MINFIFLSVFAAFCAASFYGWRSIARRFEAGLPLITGEAPAATPLGLVDVGILFVTWIFGQLVAGLGLQLAGISLLKSPGGSDLAMAIGVMAICQLGSTALGLTIIHFRYRSLQLLGLQWTNWRSEIKLGLIVFVLVVPPLLILQWSLAHWVEYSHASMDALKENPALMSLSAVWFGAVISAPICEEIFFRGILQPWLQRVAGREDKLETLISGGWTTQTDKPTAEHSPWTEPPAEGAVSSNAEKAFVIDANNPYLTPSQLTPVVHRTRTSLETGKGAGLGIFLSSLIFAAVHIGQGLAPIPLFFMGLALGYLYFKTNSLLPCIVLHMGLNAFSMFWFTIGLFV